MDIDLGKLISIKPRAFTTEFRERKQTVTSVSIFMDFEKVKGVNIALNRKAAIELVDKIKDILEIKQS